MRYLSRSFFTCITLILLGRPWAPDCALGQDVKLQDIPAEGIAPAAIDGLAFEPALRKSLEEAIRTKDYTRAETMLVGEVNKSPRSPELLKLLGGIFFLDGKYLNSAIAFKKADAIAPLDKRSRFTLALAYVIFNHGDWARPELEKLTKSDPKNPLYPYWLGRLDYDATQYSAAVAHFQEALKLHPRSGKGYDNLGLCYEALAKYDEAVKMYQEAVRLNREEPQGSPWPPLNLGALLIKLGRLDEAETYLKESLRYDPNFAKAHFQLGLLLEKENKDHDAIQELERAISCDPTLPEPHYVLGRMFRKQGESKRAELEWSQFQQLKKAKPHLQPH